MKKIFCLLVCLPFFSHAVLGQIDRSHAPGPGPAPVINVGTAEGFRTANGIQVFVVEDHEIPEVTVSLVLKKDPVLEKDKAGYVEMTGEMMRRGTETRTKVQLDEDIDFLGGSLGTGSSSAWASSLTRNFDKLFDIFSDVVLHPAFRDSELVKLKTQTRSALQAQKDDPEAISSNVVSVVNYGKDFPYGEVVTDSSVRDIGAEDLKGYYRTYWKPNICYMAFVGDITVTHARALVTRYLSSWKAGDVPAHHYPDPRKPDTTLITVVDKPSAVQTNIHITDPVMLKPGTSEHFPVRVMNHILGGGTASWLFQDLRERYGFTYAVSSRLSSDPVAGSFMASAAVRTAVTDSALGRFLYELNRIRTEKVDPAVLDSAKNEISGNFALALEQPSVVAQFALNIARYGMAKDFYKNYLKSIAAVTADQVQQAARRYIQPDSINIVLVGNAAQFADSLYRFGQLRYVDMYGNPVEAPVKKTAPSSVTARGVISHYLDAIGGTAALKAVHDMTMMLDARTMARQLAVTRRFLAPDYYDMRMQLAGGAGDILHISVRGDSASMTSMGSAVPLNQDRRRELVAEASLFPELHFSDSAHTLKLAGIRSVDGKDAYQVDVTTAAGTTSYYFDTSSGLKLRTVASEQTPAGTVQRITDMANYQEVDGIRLPYSLRSQVGSRQVSMEVKSVKINSGLKPADFP